MTPLGARVLQTTVCNASEWANDTAWHSCVFDPTPAQTGEPLFGLFVGSAVVLGLYLAGNGDMAAPTVTTILFAGLFATVLPGGMVGVAWAVAFIGFVAGLLAVGQRYVLNPATR